MAGGENRWRIGYWNGKQVGHVLFRSDFPGGLVAKSPSCNVGDEGRGTRIPQSVEQLSLCAVLTKKYSHNLKVENYFIWWECLGLRACETASL